MVRSLAIIIVPVVLLYWLFSSEAEPTPVQVIDYGPTVREATEKAPYPVMAPEGLAEEWRPVQASYFPKGETADDGKPAAGNRFTLGFLSPDDIHYGVVQTDQEPEEIIGELSRGGQQQGEETIEGRQWERWRSPDGRTGVLASTTDGVTITVTADTDFTRLADFARTLQPQS